ncbi:hypothetical protein GMOD_00005621 [Pyrenophora seminiperda CCB06]|uniref:Utp8 beta-propeller domain-containing protein n=1 Tax=Pyrenophora seminiperda CCB06 TaxID=1302712 RepID=A0A3M7M9Q4_9PLEO|nr:hypothetical protein GMOD_00005621 [Pyrenophora seminiperda CCB06]
MSSSNGRVHAAGVCSASGAKKRKRTEIAVAVDGEGVSIYSLQNPQLVTSYALPPSATFTIAPYSIYRKGPPKTPAHRFTYVSLAGSSPAEKAQLVCFHDKTSGDHTETTKTSYTPPSPAAISTLELIPVAPGGSAIDHTHDLLVTFDNGDVACLSENLSVVRWVSNLKSLLSPGKSDVEIEHIALASAKSVTRGLLRNRQDIATILDPNPDATSDLLDLVQVLCVVGRDSNGARTLTLLQVQPRSADLTTTQLTPLKSLLSWDLPSPVKRSSKNVSPAQIALHPSSSALHILTNGKMLSYDLSGTVPKLYSDFILPGSSVDSFLRTSQDVVFTTSQNTCRVFDVKYNSLQALYSISSDLSTDSTSPSKKRKHEQSDSNEHKTSPCSLVAYYADIGLVVAAREDEVFGMQFGGALPRKRAKTEGTLLIDALGKGVTSEAKALEGQKWQERKWKINKYAAKGKIAKFERQFASDLGIELESASVAQKHENEINGGPLTNGVGPSLPDEDAMVVDELDDAPAKDDLPRWKIPTTIPGHQRQLYRQYALYGLSKIFYLSDTSKLEESEGHLRVGFFPPNVFQWLLQTGQLTKESIRRALLDESHCQIQSVSEIVDGDIVKALVDYDTDLHILSAVLNHTQFLPIGEVVQAIKLLIQSIDDEPKEGEATKLLTNGTAPSEDEMDLDFATELEAASHEIDHALSVLDHGLLTRSHTLRPALIRLHTFSAPMISNTLRSMLPRRDLESLIRLLHLELKNGGWSSPLGFVDSESPDIESSGEDPDDHAVSIIASLLSSTLDAIGAGAWLASVGTRTASESGDDMLKSLNKDTSIALSGFFEAHFIRGLLSEFLRYASTVPVSKKPSNKKLELQGKPFGVTGKLNGEEDLPMLPLGGKADQGVEKMKSGKGGKKEQRSKREMGMLISKRVPKYSFERIVV